MKPNDVNDRDVLSATEGSIAYPSHLKPPYLGRTKVR